ncbi:DUF2264 domain-containing protein [Nonomuraea maheshkhaliensis]|uniref:DUF2264 domain-containing protein n=1 Tax=Nonomuraea maheshkhaliensis TaxID=419590 RepID=A0ABP4SIY7_9ACTN
MTNPLAGNPLRTRADLQEAVRSLCAPLAPRFSPGGARVRLGSSGAAFDDTAAELEGFARPLWGLAPLAAGGGDFDGWDAYVRGLTNGADPGGPEFWGDPADRDQRLVEMAAIGFAVALVPERVWEPLTPQARDHLVRWLSQINRRQTPDNNWLFFRVLVNLGLARVGADHDPAATREALDRLESFSLGDHGWYSDGPTRQRDYYVPFAMHFYGLIYAALADSSERAERFRDRAALFARDFAHWFTADGAAVPYGRSLTYRFAQGAFWGALAFADVEALPWGVLKGLALRHLRWWSRLPIFQPDATLSIGYGYANLIMAEGYNSPGSPYWALKFFLPLALPETHPFWLAEESPLPDSPRVHAVPEAGLLLVRDEEGRQVTALSDGGQWADWEPRHVAEKYTKFAYSSAFGFSVPAGGRGLAQAAADNMLALSEDGVHYHVRARSDEAAKDGEALRSVWRPMPGVEVETWLVPGPPWHLRVHRVRCERPLTAAEGGFAVGRDGLLDTAESEGAAWACGPSGGSGLLDLSGTREGRVILTEPNTNLITPRAALPTLVSRHEAGEHWLACAVLADPDGTAWRSGWSEPPALPAWLAERMGTRSL